MAIGRGATDGARKEVEKAREVVSRWQDRQASAEASLAVLRAGVGDRLLDDEEAARELPRQMAGLRDEVELCGQALAAAGPRVQAAEVAYLEAEAAALEPQVRRAREAVEAFDKRTQELRDALQEHAGGEWRRWAPTGDELAQLGPAGYRSRDPRNPLLSTLSAVTAQQAVLRAVAAGDNPGAAASGLPVSEWPAVVYGPDAVVPCQAWTEEVRRREEVPSTIEGVDQQIAALDAEIAAMTDQWAHQGELFVRDRTAPKRERRHGLVEAREALAAELQEQGA